MLSLGDKVVHPMHGAGTIKSVEEQTVNGKTQSYFVLEMVFGQMTLKVPIDGADVVGIRLVMEKSQFDNILTNFSLNVSQQSYTSWNRRVNAYVQKLKSGDVYQVADVVRELIVQAKNKKLSAGERRILSLAKQILLSEVMLSFSCDLTMAQDWLEAKLLTC